jgi:hypothetical protein
MNAQRVLLTWGVVWLLIWLIGGLCIGPGITSARDEKKTHFVEALKQVSAGDLQKAEQELTEGIETENSSRNRVSAHSHALGLALLVLFFGLIQPFLGLAERVRGIFAWVLVVGTLLQPIGVLVKITSVTAGISIVVIGGALTIISVIVAFVGVIKYVSPESKSV